MALVTIFQTFNSAEAQLVRSRLEANGFHVTLVHEHSASVYPVATGGCLIQVPEEHSESARALLSSTEAVPPNENSA